MRNVIWGLGLAALCGACEVDQPSSPSKNNVPDAHANGGSGGAATTTGTGTGGTSAGVTGGGAGTSAAGSGGTDSADAATNVEDASAGDGFDGRLPIVYCDGGSTYAGMALHLDGGSSYGTLPRPVQDDFTLEAWIKTTTSLSGNQFWQGIGLFHADTQGGNNDFGASIINDGFAFGMGLGPGLEDVMLQSTSTVTSGDWMHVAVTRKKSTGEVLLFVNGNMENSSTYAQVSSLSAATNMTIGGNTIDGHYFNGDLDEVRIWERRALTGRYHVEYVQEAGRQRSWPDRLLQVRRHEHDDRHRHVAEQRHPDVVRTGFEGGVASASLHAIALLPQILDCQIDHRSSHTPTQT